MSEESGREWMIEEFAEIGYTEEEIDSLLEETSDDFEQKVGVIIALWISLQIALQFRFRRRGHR